MGPSDLLDESVSGLAHVFSSQILKGKGQIAKIAERRPKTYIKVLIDKTRYEIRTSAGTGSSYTTRGGKSSEGPLFCRKLLNDGTDYDEGKNKKKIYGAR